MTNDADMQRPVDGRRIAIVQGVRTPFARQATAYRDVNAIDLGSLVVSELLARTEMDPECIQRLVFGQVGILPQAPNAAREVLLGAGMPPRTDAYTVSRACATGLQAVADIAQAVRMEEIDTGIAGGTDSASVLPIQVGDSLARALIQVSRARGWRERLRLLRSVRPRDLIPRAPAVRDYSTGLGMGDIAEQMARNHGISREEQDSYAAQSHRRAHRAWEDGKLNGEVMPGLLPPFDQPLERDNTIRPNSTSQALAALAPAFDRTHGSVTAGNSSPLTDGAAAVLIVGERRARELRLEPLGYIRSWAFTAIDPFNDGLMGPSHATPVALRRAGLGLEDLTLIDMHEAFAAQVLANIRNWPSRRFARDTLGIDQPIGEVDPDRFNVLGGSLAFGHPFAATGTRMITQTLRELRRRGGGPALVTACAAGGLGAAMVLEVV